MSMGHPSQDAFETRPRPRAIHDLRAWPNRAADRLRRHPIEIAIVLVVVAIWSIVVARYPSVIGADWIAYRDGVDRLVDGRPVYEPMLMLGPYDYVTPAFGDFFNMPPWFLAIAGPASMLSAPLDRLVWAATVAASLGIAFAITVPRRYRSTLLPVLLVFTPVWMTLAWGNATAIVVLGVALWVAGVRRGSTSLLVFGIVLASLKLVPAIPLALYLLRAGRLRPVVLAAALIGGLTIAFSLAAGQNLVHDFAVMFANIRQTPDTNLAPSVYLARLLPDLDAVLIVRVVAITLIALLAFRRPSLAVVAGMELLVLALPLNVSSFWILHPMVVAFAWLGAGAGLEPPDRGSAASD
jgi:hypothetical protein